MTGRVSLNEYFGGDDLGFAGPRFTLRDYDADGDLDFAIGRPHEVGFQYVLFSIDSEGVLHYLPAGGCLEDGFVYDEGEDGSFRLLDGAVGFKVTLWAGPPVGTGRGYKEWAYIWDGSKFVFSGPAK